MWEVELLLGTPIFYIRESDSSPIQLPGGVLGRQQRPAEVLKSLPSLWEIWRALLVPGSGLSSWGCYSHLSREPASRRSFPVSFSPFSSAFQINKKVC